MPDATERLRNTAPWWGLLFAVATIACNLAFFARPPLQGTLPWLSLLFGIVALIFLTIGLKRAFGQSHVYRGKALAVVLTIVALLPVGISAFAFVSARKLPNSTAAPQVGQQVPDFTLPDSSGKAVSLDQLLATSASSLPAFQNRAPKAVLLIFYRGYW